MKLVLNREGIALNSSQICSHQIAGVACPGDLQRILLEWWGAGGKRCFPWRDTQDPFRVLIAEVLLHRTRADQVVPLYHSFIQRYTDISSLAQSSPDELAESFHSAGLHWRWRLLHSMAIQILTRFNGCIPQGHAELTSLPGVGHYIASAVRCFAFGHADVLLDTNTVRVTGRVFGLTVTDSSRRSSVFRSAIETFASGACCREVNLALIDLAAAICRARSPKHSICPIRNHCLSYGACQVRTGQSIGNIRVIVETRTNGQGDVSGG